MVWNGYGVRTIRKVCAHTADKKNFFTAHNFSSSFPSPQQQRQSIFPSERRGEAPVLFCAAGMNRWKKGKRTCYYLAFGAGDHHRRTEDH